MHEGGAERYFPPWPMLAPPELAKKIIDDVAAFSAPFGTAIELKDGIGVVRVGATTSDH
jgi:hypothetical protein